jgi:hypothetical protein
MVQRVSAERLGLAANRAPADVLTSLHLPTRDELLAQAQAMFARTRSLDEIVDRAYELLLGSVGLQLDAHFQLRPQLARAIAGGAKKIL